MIFFVIADTARPDSKDILPISNSGMWAATMRETAASVRNKALVRESVSKIAPKESSETDFSNEAAGNDRRDWLSWLAA